MGPGGKGSPIASMGVKIGSWGLKKKGTGQPYPQNLFPQYFISLMDFLGGGGDSMCNTDVIEFIEYTLHIPKVRALAK